jgi:hypothetical protein
MDIEDRFVHRAAVEQVKRDRLRTECPYSFRISWAVGL